MLQTVINIKVKEEVEAMTQWWFRALAAISEDTGFV